MPNLAVLLFIPLIVRGFVIDDANIKVSDNFEHLLTKLKDELGGRISKLENNLEEQKDLMKNELKKHEDLVQCKKINGQLPPKLNDELCERISKLENDLEEQKDLLKVVTLRSCAEYADFGLTVTGFYWIDPDGPLIGHEPLLALCNFTSGSTEILHDVGTLNKVGHCNDAGCYEKDVTYRSGGNKEPIPAAQIDALIQLSDNCDQEFYYECTSAPLRVYNYKNEETDFVFWTDRHGEENTYFTGTNKGSHSCDCHFTDEGCKHADTRGNTCNCDANLPTPLSDSGTITNMTALPVTKLSFGGLMYNAQKSAFKLGNLRCHGKSDPEIGSSCSALKIKGQIQSGYYDIKKPGDHYTSLVFCNMTEDGYLEVPQTDQPDRSSPLGTIDAWISHPAGGSSQPIPAGWVSCNGSLIEKGPWAGAKTPDLNSGHFLRGGDLGQQLEMEEDQLQDHLHNDRGHTHSASSSASSHSHRYTDKYIGYGKMSSHDFYLYNDGTHYGGQYRTPKSKTTNSASGSVSTTVNKHTSGISGVSSSYRKGGETRPKNMKILWIMKCW